MLELDLSKKIPIYKQISEGFKTKILRGELEPDQMLPSIRALATSLRINPNTIKKAYNVLEGQGFIYSVPGKGSYVKELKDGQRTLQVKEIKELLDKAMSKAENISMTREEWEELTRTVYLDGKSKEGINDRHH